MAADPRERLGRMQVTDRLIELLLSPTAGAPLVAIRVYPPVAMRDRLSPVEVRLTAQELRGLVNRLKAALERIEQAGRTP